GLELRQADPFRYLFDDFFLGHASNLLEQKALAGPTEPGWNASNVRMPMSNVKKKGRKALENDDSARATPAPDAAAGPLGLVGRDCPAYLTSHRSWRYCHLHGGSGRSAFLPPRSSGERGWRCGAGPASPHLQPLSPEGRGEE